MSRSDVQPRFFHRNANLKMQFLTIDSSFSNFCPSMFLWPLWTISPRSQYNFRTSNPIVCLARAGVLEGEGGKKILEGMKLYRDRFSHTVGTYPSIEETILVIVGSTHLVKKLAENIGELEFLASSARY